MEPSRGEKTICVPFESEKHYEECMQKPEVFRQELMALSRRHPELFPARFEEGFRLDGKRFSKKQQLSIRRIELEATGEKFSIRPSFVLPYMSGTTEEVEKGLYLRHWAVPYEALSYVFGHPPMFWYRAEML